MSWTKIAADPVLDQIAKLAEGKTLVSLRKPLESLFKPKDIDFSFDPVPHFYIKHGGKKIIIVNKKYAEGDEAAVTVGEIAIGYTQ